MAAANLESARQAGALAPASGARTIPVLALGMGLSLFLVITHVIWVGFDLLFPGHAMHQNWLPLLPGFIWLTWPTFLLGLVESIRLVRRPDLWPGIQLLRREDQMMGVMAMPQGKARSSQVDEPKGFAGRKPMEFYDFEVRKGDETIAAARSVALRDPSAAWPRIADFAKNVAEPGCRIRVTNEAHEIVILIGIAAARCTATLIGAGVPNAESEITGRSIPATVPPNSFAAKFR